MKHLKPIIHFLFETGMLARTPRSFSSFLGSGTQSVAEHVHRTTMIGYILSMMDKKINRDKLLLLCLLHDSTESRISDLNYVHQKYNERNENKASQDITSPLPFGNDMKYILQEYKEQRTRESILAKDANNLEFLLTLKEQIDTGNVRAKSWIPPAKKRIKTAIGKKLAKEIMKTDSDAWWFSDKKSSWWVDRK